MNPAYQPYEQIDLYLQGLLSESDATDVENRLNTDAEFNSLFEAQKQAYELVEQYEFLQLKKELQLDRFEKNRTLRKYTQYLRWGLSLLASAVLLTVAWYFHRNAAPLSVDPSSGELIEEKLTNNPNTPSTIKPKEKTETDIAYNAVSVQSNPSVIDSTQGINNVPVLESPTEETTMRSDHKISTPQEISKNTCEGLVLQAEVSTTGTCFNKQDGIIELSDIHGGTAPYTISINNSDHFLSAHRLEALKAGSYSIAIKDKNGCVSVLKKKATIPIMACSQKLDFSFSPNQEEEWKYPLKEETSSVRFTLFNQNGILVHEANIEDGHPAAWNGISSRYGNLDAGYYMFTLEYSDGTTEKGSLTIIK